MTNIKKVLCILFYIIIVFNLKISALTNEIIGENFFDVLYNNLNGLPTSEANDIEQTDDGYIWIASYSSLIRYDGKDFVSYAEKSGLTSVLCLYKDIDGRLWIGTNNDGAIVYENNEFKFISTDTNINSFSARAITQTKDKTILVGTAMGMYAVNEKFSIEIIEDDRISNSYITKLESFGENKTIGLTKSGDIFILNGLEVEAYIPMNEFLYDVPISVYPEENGESFFIGTSGNYLVKLSKKDDEFIYETINTGNLKYINAVASDKEGNIWICSDFGVGYINKSGNLFVLENIVADASMGNFLQDTEGNYWFTSTKFGVLKINISSFKNISRNIEDLGQVNAVEIYDGLIYIVSANGIDIIDEKNYLPIENALTQRYRGEYFRCVEKDFEGNLWFSGYSQDRLVKYTPKTGEIITFGDTEGLYSERIRSTMVSKDGKIWVATGNGVFVIENDEIIEIYNENDGIENLEILTISENSKGDIFIGTDGAGLYIIENGKVVQNFSRENGLYSNSILRTENDPFNDGTWIVTGNSLAFLSIENELINIEHFPYGNNFDLLFYEDEMIILSSNGIYFANHANMLNTDTKLTYLHNNHLDGILSNPVANSFSKIEDGALFLCGYQNLTYYNLGIEEDKENYIPPISIPRIAVNGEIQYESSENTYLLQNTANYILFEILIPTFALKDYQISYQMLGYDELIHTNSYKSFTNPTYTNLPGGTYQFVVKLIDNRSNQVVNEQIFKIIKEPTFFENTLIQTILTTIIISTFFIVLRIIIKYRERKIRERQNKLQDILQDIVEVLAKVIDAKDRYTNGHSTRVAIYSKVIAENLHMSTYDVDSIYNVALLHDIGKITIPDELLNKKSGLDDGEYDIMRTHTERGASILEGIHEWPDLAIGAKYHHECYDGTGYGDGLKGNEIPLIARIICVADAFDAMYSSRTYRKQMDISYVMGELEKNKGTQFDPKIVDVFLNLIKSGKLDNLIEEFTE